MMEFNILMMGDCAVEIEFGRTIDPQINGRVLWFRQKIEQAQICGITETVPAYCTLTVCYDPLILSWKELCDILRTLYQKEKANADQKTEGKLIWIPVCYGGEFGPDLGNVAALHDLTEDEVIRIHTAPEYPVYMLGFIAGFPYLGGMDERLETPRLEVPRSLIAGGSVGIAGKQTGIYPVQSPGGWQLIGRTPLRLYDPERTPVCLLQPGDKVRFVQIGRADFKRIEEEGTWEF